MRAAVALAEILVEGEGDVPDERACAMLLVAQAVAGGGSVVRRAVVRWCGRGARGGGKGALLGRSQEKEEGADDG